LEQARTWGLLGPASIADHLRHAQAFAEAIGGPPEGVAVDMGSGGGLPGLPLAHRWPESRWVLIDARKRAGAFLAEAVDRLGLSDRVEVACDRVEVLVAGPHRRGRYSLVVARAFGPPAVTAEGAAPLLSPGGTLVVSEPPAPGSLNAAEARGLLTTRWPAAGLALLGMTPQDPSVHGTFHFQVIRQEHACPSRYPRRVGVGAKRPLF